MTETLWYTRKYYCRNGVVERTKFPVTVRSGLSKKKKENEANRAARTSDTAVRQAARLLNNNFEEREDLHLVFEYDDTGLQKVIDRAMKKNGGQAPSVDEIYVSAQQELVNWVRRVQRKLGKGTIFLYFGTTSDMDGETQTPVRIHHHVVIAGRWKDVAVEKWTAGYVWEDELYYVNGDFTSLAEYLINQVRYIRNLKRYMPSRFLQPPRVEKPREVTRYAGSEMKPPKGAVLLYRSPYVRGQSQYIRYKITDPLLWEEERLREGQT